MKKDGTRNAADNDGTGSLDVAEVRRRVVNAITQLVGDAIEQDWFLLSSGSAAVAGADEANERTDSPAGDASAVSTSPSTEVPLGHLGELPPSRLRSSYFPPERGMPAWPTPNYELPRRRSFVDPVLNGVLRRRLSPDVFDYAESPPNRSNSSLYRFGYGYGPYRHLEPLLGGRFEMTDIRPTEFDLVPSELPLSRRRRLILLSPRNPYE